MDAYPEEYYQFFIHFNEGDYYTCHDLLEEMWLTDKSNLFLKGLLQMSVALYHYSYGNLKGTRSMMLAGRQYIQPYRPHHWGMDLEKVHHFMENCLLIIPQVPDKIPFEMTNSLPRLPMLFLYLE
ncbi:DUF309 domain-containing protein [Bacillus sp. FJAT-42376]|uniref:DUF309 domain-containing protein n=1 Tax=Bacillus sp. FJAT-42376 TaxID=2014076 RepID=UPI000F4E892D|nr:DUF309 domain-containing protein [Bacillus sp. FJAT-42376]AZB44262.1 DUF309 domain-containing protein [Bacillus sp. FJAT-42376]